MNAPFGYCREQRLGRKEIAAVLASGRRFKGSMLSVQVRQNGLGLSRLGLIVPKRFLPSSVDRNLMKRRVREWFRLRPTAFKGCDILVRLTGPRAVTKAVGEELDRLGLPR